MDEENGKKTNREKMRGGMGHTCKNREGWKNTSNRARTVVDDLQGVNG